MRIIRPADLVRMPWKNGGGETTEIAVSPEGSGLDRFDWRVSMARIARNGPFSEFAEVDRTLAVLDGAGVRLAIAGRAPIELTACFRTALVPGRSADHGHAGRRPRARSQRHDPPQRISARPRQGSPSPANGSCESTAARSCCCAGPGTSTSRPAVNRLRFNPRNRSWWSRARPATGACGHMQPRSYSWSASAQCWPKAMPAPRSRTNPAPDPPSRRAPRGRPGGARTSTPSRARSRSMTAARTAHASRSCRHGPRRSH